MKKALAVALSALTVFSLAACGSSTSSTSSSTASSAASSAASTASSAASADSNDRLAKIKEQGYIEVVTEPYFAPYEFIDPSKTGQDQYEGMDMEIAKYIADKIGVELKIVPLEFSAVLASITEGKYDLAISAIAYSPAREEAMKLSKGYYYSENDEGYGLLCREEDKDKYTTLDSVKDAVVTTQSGSVQESLYNEFITNSGCKSYKVFSSMTEAFLAVQEGRADVCICARANGQLYCDANGGLSVTEFKFDADPELSSTRIGAPLTGSDSLMEVVNECIDELLAKNQTSEWYKQYEAVAKQLGVE